MDSSNREVTIAQIYCIKPKMPVGVNGIDPVRQGIKIQRFEPTEAELEAQKKTGKVEI